MPCLVRSSLIQGAWSGKLVHLAGLDVIGSTAGSLGRLLQDREVELWQNNRIVAPDLTENIQVSISRSFLYLYLSAHMSLQLSEFEDLSIAHSSFRVISTASKSIPLKDWLSDEHANMFFTIPSQPMGLDEESQILLSTGCAPNTVKTLLEFAERYRQSISEDNFQKNRKLGTRTLLRISRKVAKFPEDDDLHRILSQSLLAEFLPPMERMNLNALLEESDIREKEISASSSVFTSVLVLI